jgi:hypothetical protein
LFGLTVFGIIEHFLWPVSAADRMRGHLSEVLRSLAGLALLCTGTGYAGLGDVDERRRLISQQVADMQGLIEASKFESGAAGSGEIERLTGDAQSLFLVLLAIARDESGRAALPDAVRERTRQLETDIAAALAAVAERVQNRQAAPPIDVDEAMGEVERAVSAHVEQGRITREACRGMLALYRELVGAVKRLSLSNYPHPLGS